MAFTDRTSQNLQRRGGDKQQQLDEHILQLKKIYAQELQSLKQLFSEWSDADLVATLEEVGGDLDLAIGRISEGHAEQWGEVKKRERKEKPKQAAPASEGVATSERPARPPKQFGARETTRPARGGTYAGRGGRGGGRGGRGGGRGGAMLGGFRGGRPTNGSHKAGEAKAEGESTSTDEWGNAPVTGDWGETAKDDAADGGEPATNDGWSGASPAQTDSWSADVQPERTTAWGASPQTENVATQQKKKAVKPEGKPVKAAETVKAPAPVTAKPKSWAALVKGPEPVPVAVPKSEPKQSTSVKSPAPASESENLSPVRVPSPVRAASPVKSPVRDSNRMGAVKTPEPETKSPIAAPSSVSKAATRPSSPPKPSSAVATPVQAPAQPKEDTTAGKASAPPGFKQARPAPFSGRKLRQDAAVVMPSNASLSSIGVQFGSLRLGGNSDVEEDEKESATAQSGVQSAKAPTSELGPSPGAAAPQQLNPGAPQVGLAPQHLQQHQLQHQQQVQQQGARDSRINATSSMMPQIASGLQSGLGKQADGLPVGLPSTGPAAPGLPNGVAPYGSYFPSQQLAAASGFGLGHMGNLPAEYSALYGSDAQSRAAMMHGYYDPAAYQQAAPSKYQGQEATTGQQASQTGQASPSSGQQQQSQQPPQQQQPQPQQGYPLPYPYYPYYHMNQFPSYQGSPYGQPFVNKSMYPGYPQQSQQPTTGAAATPKAGAASNSGYGYSTTGQQHSQSQHQGQHQPQLYQQGSYDDLAAGLGGHEYKGVYGGIPQQSFQSFGLHQGGMQGVSAQNKAGPNSQTAQSAGQQDYKAQSGNRPPRQTYEAHKYQTPTAATGSQQQGAGTGATGTGTPSGPGSYYNQQHLAGLHSQQPAQVGNPYLQMHHQYQGANIYGQGRQQGQYWSGQS
ncbi:uncharacterized protein SPPG_05343 [Spizellomyces punctatus DAOM BR117]|uniref:RNA polymerase II degradation factor 1 n=1 Tax=Spizellomyces punctatus (strain DAOM BR117) TaxID=645134 RepID=A0A0L0HGK2_SPIPD|nr:uncharacterized protein SPPG_05343 [Spizellomyces punctatus DAOM BR117]KNC99968.1 hypothetical protein SPPG_05343 [Spizellomyces punctatus DAOM BR117]|eukprot:XP_016608008.1 hypothetical protein SPPG_05343 [Spizellomyces punctatus DAOM BR117]